ncbi:MAG: hypothetical protein QM729_07345 [Solirubrobacterales bacterium]
MAITIDAGQRDALYALLRLRLGAIDEVSPAPDGGRFAARLGRELAAELRLMEDLGWAERSRRTSFELTMPAEELRPLLTRLQRMSIDAVETYLARPRRKDEKGAIGDLAAAMVCGELLNALSTKETEDPR